MENKNLDLVSVSFVTNPSIVSRFPEATIILVNKDYPEITTYSSPYLAKNVIGVTVKCGLSRCTYDPKTYDDTILLDDDEWCLIEIMTPVADFENSECCVKAKDLLDYRTLSKEDLASRGLC